MVGRPGGSYGWEPSHFSYDQSGTSFFNIGQRFDTTSNTAHAYFLYAEPAQGGLLLSRADADAAVTGRLMDAGTWVAESRSVITAQRTQNATPVLLGLYNGASLPSPGPSSTFDNNRSIEIIRWSADTATPGDITFIYYDNSGTRYFWNGSAWTTSTAGRARPADNAREVVASITDDGTNYILKVVYADDGSLVAGPAPIAKSAVRSMPLGRVLWAGDLFTDAWTDGLFLRYLDVRPYAAIQPSITVGNTNTLAGWSYDRSLTDVNGTSLTNFVTKVALTSSNFDFALAKPDGSDLRVYDATTGAVLPIWLPDYNSVARTATVYYLATNTGDATYLYYGNTAAAAVSNFSAVFPHGTDFTSAWGDLSTATAGATAAAATYPAAASPSDPRNLAVWTQAESPTLSISDLTAAGIPAGNYTGIYEFSLVRDANDRVLQVNGKYYAFFARRPSVTTAPIDTWRCESTSPTGPWTNFTKVYTPPSPIRLGYAGSTIKIGSTYYLFLTYGWARGGGVTPGITVYVMTSQDLTNWSPVSKSLDPGIFKDQTGGPVTNIGNPWVIRCADGTYMMTVEGYGAGNQGACYGATSTDLVNWTALNSGNPLVAKGTGSQWDFNGVGNPKCLQMPDGSYVIQYSGSDDPTNGDLEIGFATAPSRGGPYTKLAANPVVGRPGGSYGWEPSHFSYDQSGTSFFNIGQRFDTTSNTGHAYFLYAEPAQGGLLLSRADADGAVAGRLMDAGPWVAESRSVITAQRTKNATPVLLGLYNGASLPSPGPSSTLDGNRSIEIIRWSADTATPGDITFMYYDNSGTRYFWNGSAWTTSIAGRARPADNAREVVASITDDGTNYILKVVYADDGSLVAGPAPIAKSAVRSMPAGRYLWAGDPFTDQWTGGLFLRYLDVRPYAAIQPSIVVGNKVVV